MLALTAPAARNGRLAIYRGGRQRDRTSDPFHVKEVRGSEIADFIGINGTKNGAEGRYIPLMFSFSGPLNLRALPRTYSLNGVRSETASLGNVRG